MPMFNFKKQNIQPQAHSPMKASSGCKIKVRRDSNGRVTSIETNGMCSRGELEIFKENMGLSSNSEEEDE